MAKVSIIVLSFNTIELLYRCLSSVRLYVSDLDYELIVVDNNSSDGSYEMVQSNFPKVKLIKSEVNLGFGKGINLAASQASGDLLLFLNSDCVFIDSSLVRMSEAFTKYEKLGVAGGAMKNPGGTFQRSYGKFYNLKDVVIMLFGREKLETFLQQKSEHEVDWVSGGFMLVGKEVFNKVGKFDENIFMYIEDMEICYRVKQNGYKVIFYPECEVIHEGQGSSDRAFAIINIYKGIKYYYHKHKNIIEYWLVSFLLLLKAVIAIIIGIITRNKSLVETYQKALSV